MVLVLWRGTRRSENPRLSLAGRCAPRLPRSAYPSSDLSFGGGGGGSGLKDSKAGNICGTLELGFLDLVGI